MTPGMTSPSSTSGRRSRPVTSPRPFLPGHQSLRLRVLKPWTEPPICTPRALLHFPSHTAPFHAPRPPNLLAVAHRTAAVLLQLRRGEPPPARMTPPTSSAMSLRLSLIFLGIFHAAEDHRHLRRSKPPPKPLRREIASAPHDPAVQNLLHQV